MPNNMHCDEAASESLVWEAGVRVDQVDLDTVHLSYPVGAGESRRAVLLSVGEEMSARLGAMPAAGRLSLAFGPDVPANVEDITSLRRENERIRALLRALEEQHDVKALRVELGRTSCVFTMSKADATEANIAHLAGAWLDKRGAATARYKNKCATLTRHLRRLAGLTLALWAEVESHAEEQAWAARLVNAHDPDATLADRLEDVVSSLDRDVEEGVDAEGSGTERDGR